MQASDGLSIPVQVRKHKKSLIVLPLTAVITEDNIFLLSLPINDVPNPVQTALVALPLHQRPDLLCIDLRRLCHHTDSLRGVFLDMLFRAGIDEVEF